MNTVANLTQILDHPDLPTQKAAAEELIAMGAEALPTIFANLGFATPRARRALMTVIEKIGDSSALLPLMRFIWDSRETIEDSDARGLAMKAIASLARPEDGARLLPFLIDVAKDDDAFVRGWSAETLAHFGDPRAETLIKAMLKDPSEVVRERAESALHTLAANPAPTDALKPAQDDETLLKSIRSARGNEQVFWLNELKSRENAFELATRLVREGGRAQILGLQYLLDSQDPAARGIARFLLMRESDSPLRAVALRIIAQHLNGDADSDEAALIRTATFEADPFVRLAAMECAGLSGDPDLTDRAVLGLRDRDPEIAASCSRGLARSLTTSDRHHFPQLLEAFDSVHRRRLSSRDDTSVRTEAYILRAIGKVVGDLPNGDSQIQQVALKALFDAEDLRPILVTALDLLEQATPTKGVPPTQRWSADKIRDLAMLASSSDREVRTRTLHLLVRGAQPGIDSLTPIAQRLTFEPDEVLISAVIPLLELVGSERARTILTEFSNHSNEAVVVAAQASLQRWRNSQKWMDAEFDEKF